MSTKPSKQGWNVLGETELTLEQLEELQQLKAQRQFGPAFPPQPDQLVGVDCQGNPVRFGDPHHQALTRPYTTAFEAEIMAKLDRILRWIEGQEASDARLDAVIATADRGPYGPDDLLNEAQAMALLGGRYTPVGRTSFLRGVKTGAYPQPLKIGPDGGTNRWLVSELSAVIDAAARNRSADGEKS